MNSLDANPFFLTQRSTIKELRLLQLWRQWQTDIESGDSEMATASLEDMQDFCMDVDLGHEMS